MRATDSFAPQDPSFFFPTTRLEFSTVRNFPNQKGTGLFKALQLEFITKILKFSRPLQLKRLSSQTQIYLFRAKRGQRSIGVLEIGLEKKWIKIRYDDNRRRLRRPILSLPPISFANLKEGFIFWRKFYKTFWMIELCKKKTKVFDVVFY